MKTQHGRVLILGGDGFCGWPTSLHLSNLGFEVLIIDDFSRRRIDFELQVDTLTPIRSLHERLSAWERISGRAIPYMSFDIAERFEELKSAISSFRPSAIVHFAEQKSAPYSMKSSYLKRYTVSKNTSATTNLLCALLETGIDAHIVHLGTMGVYGYQTTELDLPEGYLEVQVADRKGNLVNKKILHPFDPGSVYHLTKCFDSMLFYYFNKQDGIRVTDLHQGIVWGTHTPETQMSEELINRFDYDGDFGTVLNRFLIQAAIGYPLTVHGAGNQKRAFINIRDTVRCIQLAIENPPQAGDQVQIYNQLTEIYRVSDLADLVSSISGVSVQTVSNPRTEDENNQLAAKYENLIKLGLEPTMLREGLLSELIEIAKKYGHRIDKSKIPCSSAWSHAFKQ